MCPAKNMQKHANHQKNMFPATMVESQTVVGTKQHGRGTVDAQIIKADIPVQVYNFLIERITKEMVDTQIIKAYITVQVYI